MPKQAQAKRSLLEGLLARFHELKETSGAILRMNQRNMEEASGQARQMARSSIVGFGIGLTGGDCRKFVARQQLR